MSLRHLLATVAFLTTLPSLAGDEPSPEVKEKVRRIRKDVERKARMEPGDEKLTCPVMVEEIRSACRDQYRRGLPINCYRYIKHAEMVTRQREGTLFEIPAEKLPPGKTAEQMNAQVADTACRVHLKSLRRERQRKDSKMEQALPWGPRCSALLDRVDAACIALIGEKELPRSCQQILQVFPRKPSTTPTDSEKSCETFSEMLAP